MKPSRIVAAIGAFTLLTAVALWGGSGTRQAGAPVFSGGAYLTIIKDAGGYFASRSVITLHADHTMMAVDSAEQGPTYYFSGQLGGWKPVGSHRLLGRMINFQYPMNSSGPGIARADYVINLSSDRRHVSGTITVVAFPLQEIDPFGEGGTLITTTSFEGERIDP